MADIKFCGNCGAKLIENADFCSNCGNKVEVGQHENNENSEENVYWSLPTEDTFGKAINKTNNSKRSTKFNIGLIIAGIVAAVLVVMAFIGMVVEKTLQNTPKNETENITTESEEEIDVNSYFDDEENEKEYEKGILTDTSYESEFVGVKYTAPDGWVLASESELAELPTDEKTTWEMQAFSSLDGSNIVLATEKLPMKNMTLSMYITFLTNSLKNNDQLTVSDIKEYGTMIIAGEEYHILSYTAIQNGISLTQTFYLRKINTYMIAITVTSAGTPNEDILSGFEKY